MKKKYALGWSIIIWLLVLFTYMMWAQNVTYYVEWVDSAVMGVGGFILCLAAMVFIAMVAETGKG